eukprot:tig00000849_g4783.t1
MLSQKRTEPIIALAPFTRTVKEITEDVLKELREARLTDTTALRWCRQAVLALREATEHYAIETFEGSNLLAIHAKRITIQPKDMQLRKKIRGTDE